MNKLLQKVDRLRASGQATLELPPDHPHCHLSGKRFPVESIGTPGYKCRVTLLIDGDFIDFTINEIL